MRYLPACLLQLQSASQLFIGSPLPLPIHACSSRCCLAVLINGCQGQGLVHGTLLMINNKDFLFPNSNSVMVRSGAMAWQLYESDPRYSMHACFSETTARSESRRELHL